MIKNNKLNSVQTSTASSALFQPNNKTMYQTEFSGFYYRSPGSFRASDIESTDLYNQESKICKENKNGLIQIQDSWSKSHAQKKYHETHPANQINNSQEQVYTKTGKKLCLLSPGIMYKSIF